MNPKETLVLEEGKYAFHNLNGLLSCDRYGKPWKEAIYDNSVLALFQKCYELELILGTERGDATHMRPGWQYINEDPDTKYSWHGHILENSTTFEVLPQEHGFYTWAAYGRDNKGFCTVLAVGEAQTVWDAMIAAEKSVLC